MPGADLLEEMRIQIVPVISLLLDGEGESLPLNDAVILVASSSDSVIQLTVP
jgi:hypothetical protein